MGSVGDDGTTETSGWARLRRCSALTAMHSRNSFSRIWTGMTERAEERGQESGIHLTREVVEALPALDRDDEAVAVIAEGLLHAAELLGDDDHGTKEM